MGDPSKNPNADTDERLRLQKELTVELSEMLRKHGIKIAAVAEDVPTFYRSILSSCFISVLTIQAITEEDKTMTVRDHMRNQFVAGKEAYRRLAEVNAAIWNEPPQLERVPK